MNQIYTKYGKYVIAAVVVLLLVWVVASKKGGEEALVGNPDGSSTEDVALENTSGRPTGKSVTAPRTKTTTPTPASPTPVAENPEGEANPSMMKLDMKKWTWISALYSDGTQVTPRVAGQFTLSFEKTGTFLVTTDCNSMSGKYQVIENKISFSEMISTLMYCEGSREGDFTKILQNTTSYHFTNRGELVFDLKFDSGTATFR